VAHNSELFMKEKQLKESKVKSTSS